MHHFSARGTPLIDFLSPNAVFIADIYSSLTVSSLTSFSKVTSFLAIKSLTAFLLCTDLVYSGILKTGSTLISFSFKNVSLAFRLPFKSDIISSLVDLENSFASSIDTLVLSLSAIFFNSPSFNLMSIFGKREVYASALNTSFRLSLSGSIVSFPNNTDISP